MWDRLREMLGKLGLLPAEAPTKHSIETPDNPEIDFRPLSLQEAAALGADTALVCPVTRQSLQRGDALFLCSNCNTAYSVEGWNFLRKTDRGRCCQCRHIGAVKPFRERETSL